MLLVLCVTLSMSLLSASFALPLVRERMSLSAELQLMAGGRPTAFCAANLVFDVVMYLVSLAVRKGVHLHACVHSHEERHVASNVRSVRRGASDALATAHDGPVLRPRMGRRTETRMLDVLLLNNDSVTHMLALCRFHWPGYYFVLC